MKKKLGIIAIIIVLVVVSMMFTGCADQIKYGTWKVTQTGNPETGVFEDSFFPITVRLEKDGTVYLYDSEFGKVKESRQNYHFEQTSDLGDEKLIQDGAWEIDTENEDGSIVMYIYPDDQKVVYKLVRIADEQP